MTISDTLRVWWTKKRTRLEPGQSWLALVSVVLMNIFIGSQEFVFSFLYDDLIERFQSTRTKVGGAYSTHWIFFTLPSLLISPLVSKYGCRNVNIVSFVIMALGYSLAGFCPNIVAFYGLFGFLAGIGSGGAYLATSTYIQKVFDDNRSVAAAIGSVGFAISAMILPSYIKLFQDMFGTMPALLLHGGLCFHGIVLSFSFRERAVTSSLEERKPIRVETTIAVDNTTEMANSDIIYIVEIDLESSEVFYIKRCVSEPKKEERNRYTASCQPVLAPESEQRSAMVQYLRDVIDPTLFKDVCLMIATTHFMLCCLGRYGILAQIASATRHRGFTSENAAFLLTVSGLGNFVAAALIILLMNIPWINPILTSVLAALFISSCGFLLAFTSSYTLLMIGAVLLGIEEAIVTANVPLLTVHLVGVDKVARGVSMMLIFLIPASFVAAPFTAWTVEITSGYVTSFIAMGAVGAISAALGIIDYFMVKRKAKKRRKTKPTDVTEARNLEETGGI